MSIDKRQNAIAASHPSAVRHKGGEDLLVLNASTAHIELQNTTNCDNLRQRRLGFRVRNNVWRGGW